MNDAWQLLSEPRLPHLTALLDTNAMRRHLGPRVFGTADTDELECDIERIKYHPAKNCLVVYRLRNRTGNQHRIACRTYEAAGAHTRYVKARAACETTVEASDIHYLPALEAVAWVFPRDRKLVHLPRLLDHQRISREVIPQLLPELGANATSPRLTLELAHYVPEHTASIRAHLHWPTPTTCITVYAKTYYDETGAATWRWQNQAYAQLGEAHELRVPRALLYEVDTRTLWQAAVPGTRLEPLAALRNPDVCRLAHALARFHGLKLQGLGEVDRPSIWASLELAMTQIGSALPATIQVLRELRAHLDVALPELFVNAANVTLHGDLHPGNILRENTQLALIDLDSLNHGPAALDLGSYLASEIYRSQVDQSARASRTRIESLRAAYESASGAPLAPYVLRTGIALALVRERARRCVTRLKAGRLELVPELLREALNLLATRNSGS